MRVVGAHLIDRGEADGCNADQESQQICGDFGVRNRGQGNTDAQNQDGPDLFAGRVLLGDKRMEGDHTWRYTNLGQLVEANGVDLQHAADSVIWHTPVHKLAPKKPKQCTPCHAETKA